MTAESCPPTRPVSELKSAEAFLLVTLRLWAAPHKEPAAGPYPDWREGFAASGIGDEGADAFDQLFLIVVKSAIRSLDVRCPRCRHIGEDEHMFLTAIGLLQRNHWNAAEDLLTCWLPAAAARAALVQAIGLAGAMSAIGMILPSGQALPGFDPLRQFRPQARRAALYH
jgi:hypothetical protein